MRLAAVALLLSCGLPDYGDMLRAGPYSVRVETPAGPCDGTLLVGGEWSACGGHGTVSAVLVASDAPSATLTLHEDGREPLVATVRLVGVDELVGTMSGRGLLLARIEARRHPGTGAGKVLGGER